MKILAIIIVTVFAFGFLFVQWANKPENVEALKKKRAMEVTKKLENEKAQAIIRSEKAIAHKEIEAKKATMKLVIDEHFADNRFEQLDFHYGHINYFKLGENEFNFSGMLTKGQHAQDYFIRSKDDFGDFTAETQLGIWGGEAFAGIFWAANDNGDNNPLAYQAAYSSPNKLYVEAGNDKSFSLGGLISSENNQLLRVERFGKHIKVSVNGRTLFDEQVESAQRGRVGIIVGHRGGIRNSVQSISIGIKSFKVWQ